MYIVFFEGKIVVLENFNETSMLMNSQNSKTTNETCQSENYFICFFLFLLVWVFIVIVILIATNKIKCFTKDRNIRLLNIHPESDNVD